VQVKLWDPLRTRAIPERLRGAFTKRRYTNPRLPFPLPLPRDWREREYMCQSVNTCHDEASQLTTLYITHSVCCSMPRPAVSCPSERCVSWSCTYSLLTRYVIIHLCEFHQIYRVRAVRHKDELIRFRGQKVKGQGHSET